MNSKTLLSCLTRSNTLLVVVCLQVDWEEAVMGVRSPEMRELNPGKGSPCFLVPFENLLVFPCSRNYFQTIFLLY